jgi:signal transduction histidine kinase
MKVGPSRLELGPDLAHTIAEAYGGKLTAAANPGGGSILTLSLPIVG